MVTGRRRGGRTGERVIHVVAMPCGPSRDGARRCPVTWLVRGSLLAVTHDQGSEVSTASGWRRVGTRGRSWSEVSHIGHCAGRRDSKPACCPL